MYDQSYNTVTLARALRKSDFRKIPSHLRDSFRKEVVDQAVQSALTTFGGQNPIAAFHLKKKTAYRIPKLEDDLVVRKLSLNLKRLTEVRVRGRSFIISNMRHFLEEGVPYRVYRLDVKSFYESFLIEHIKSRVLSLRLLTPLSKRHLTTLLDHYGVIGGQGLPRGMGISAVLSDWLMSSFDSDMLAHSAVYFYGRYVDDITIVTNMSEDETMFLAEIARKLPMGLKLNKKKESINSLPEKTQTVIASATPILNFSLSYLGYQFSVFEPQKTNTNHQKFRLVRIEIAPEKIKKIKSRIVRSFVEFKKSGDASLLLDRIKFLTSNFSVIDINTGKRKLSGVFHSYPLLSDNSESLAELDKFLRNAVLSKKGRLFTFTASMLSSEQKRNLLAMRFTYGHKTKHFINFYPAKIKKIQECWINE